MIGFCCTFCIDSVILDRIVSCSDLKTDAIVGPGAICLDSVAGYCIVFNITEKLDSHVLIRGTKCINIVIGDGIVIGIGYYPYSVILIIPSQKTSSRQTELLVMQESGYNPLQTTTLLKATLSPQMAQQVMVTTVSYWQMSWTIQSVQTESRQMAKTMLASSCLALA